MVDTVVSRLGGLEIGVNNAGIGILGADETYDIADWNRVIAVNLTGLDLLVDGGHTLNNWLVPMTSRALPPRVTPEEETVQLKRDLRVSL